MASSDELLRLYHQLLILGRLIMERMKTPGIYEDLELLNGDFQPLLMIASHEGMSQAELSHRLRRTKGATSFIVNKLEEKGLVERVHSDTRCLLHLTEKGRRICVQKHARDLILSNQAIEQMPVELEELNCANRVISELTQFCLMDAEHRNREN